MIDADIHEAGVVDDVIDAVRSRLAISQVDEVVHVDNSVFPLRLPLPAVVLEIADEFLLLAIDGDNRIASPFESFAGLFDVAELEVAVRMRHPPRCFSCWPSERTPGCL